MSNPQPTRCYYEVLNVERKASYDEIRSAYKKQALLFHPDKNHGNAEEAASKFKEVQNAYAVLSDTAEREWYDAHRDAILNGDGDGTCAPDEINLFDFFTSRCYSGFGDDEGSFYSVYSKVFDTLIDEEAGHDVKARSWPRFGRSDSADTDVSKFYSHWRNFNSYKTFSWKDEYKINEIPDRQSRRAAERINMKERSAAKRAYTQLVAELAEFVHKKDPRVQAAKSRAEAEAKAKEDAREQKELEGARRRREANEKLWAEAAEIEAQRDRERAERGELDDGTVLELLYEKQRKMAQRKKCGKGAVVGRADDALLDQEDNSGFAIQESHFDNDDDVDDTKEKVSFQCTVCKKAFHSEHQWNEHVGSSKHKTKVKQLAARGVDVDAAMKGAASDVAPSVEAKTNNPEQHVEKKRDKSDKRKPQKTVIAVESEEEDSQDEAPVAARNAFGVFAQRKRK